MNARYIKVFIFMLILVVFLKTFQHLSDTNEIDIKITDELGKVRVSVYYEALCPDSKFFITYQLLPTYEAIHDYIVLDLVPYGKAQTIEVDGKIEFHCQHDAIECAANKIHACVIEFVREPMFQLKYIACMITDNIIPDDAGEKCGRELNIDYQPILDCANDIKGSELLKKYGERTNSRYPPIKFIPMIELNGSQNLISQAAILKDFSKAVCEVLENQPQVCS